MPKIVNSPDEEYQTRIGDVEMVADTISHVSWCILVYHHVGVTCR